MHDLTNSLRAEVMPISVKQLDKNLIIQLSKLMKGDLKKSLEISCFTRFLENKYSSRILYGLLKLEFSAYWELLKLLNVCDSRKFQITISNLIQAGIVSPILRTSDQYEFILKFWKELYCHSSGNPAFYQLNNNWIDTIKLVEPIIIHSHNQDQTNDQNIKIRMDKYRVYCKKAKAELERIEEIKKNSIGECKNCGVLISMAAIRGLDYHIFPIGIICNLCDKRSDDKSKWIHFNK